MPHRITRARIGFAAVGASLCALMVAVVVFVWLDPKVGLGNFWREVSLGIGLSLLGVGLPLTLLHLRLRREAREPYSFYVLAGLLALCAVIFLRLWTMHGPLRAFKLPLLGLGFGIAGGIGGAMFRFALRASVRRGSLALVALLVVSLGVGVAGRLNEFGRWSQRPGVWREGAPPPGPVVSGVTDPKLLQLGETVRQLVETGDTDAFANATAATIEDWNELLPKSTSAPIEHPLGDDPALHLRQRKRAVTDSAERLMEIARRSGLGGDRLRWQVTSVTARLGGTRVFDVAPGQQATFREVQDVRVVLACEPTSGQPTDTGLRGDYQIRVGGVEGFPGGWRIQTGVRWAGFPAGVVDTATRGELVLTGKVADDHLGEKRTLALADDPLLGKLGDAFAVLLRNRSVPDFVTAVRSRHEDMEAFAQKFEWGTPTVTKEQFEKVSADLTASAQAMVSTLERLGIDFADAEIGLKAATAERATFGWWAFGSPNGLRADAIRFTFGVRSKRTTRDGRPITGDFGLTTGSAIRRADRWTLWDAETRWKDLPAALMTKPERERIEFESHVIEHGTLPLGMAAPDIALVRLDTGAKVQLSSYRGKVVVLEWWASWCGPCQPAMTELQELPGAQPDWKGRVEVIAVSIDDELALAQAHAAKRQWTKTTNVWAGPGATSSESARSFRVDGVPTCYILDRAGRIVFAGHPGGEPMAELVRKALRK